MNNKSSDNGPTLETYIETRFNLLEKKIKDDATESDIRYNEKFLALDSKLNIAIVTLQRAIESALASADKAITKSEISTDKRFESVNEFRSTLSDQNRTFMPREEAQVMLRAMDSRIDTNKSQIDHLVSEREGIKGGWGYAVGLIGFVIAIITLGSMFFGRHL